MFARAVYAVAALVFIVALLGLRSATRDVTHYPGLLEGGVPIMVYEPGEPRGPFSQPEFEIRLPVVVLGHGFTGNAPMMSSIARTLARRGYAVVALEFRGHGDNGNRLGARISDGRGGLYDDLEQVVQFVRTQPHFDPERVAVMGHSMGAFASGDYASWDPSVAATVLISGGGGLMNGPHRPPNVLFLWAAGDPQGLREGAAARAADLAELERLVAEKTYGEFERGTAVRTSEVPGVDHLTILYSSVAWDRIASWLAQTLGPGTEPRGDPTSDGRYGWTLLGVLSFLVLLWGGIGALNALVPEVRLPVAASPLALVELGAVLVLAVLLLTGVDAAAFGGPLGWVPLVVTRDYVTFQLMAGLLLVVYLAMTQRLNMRMVSPGATIGALLLFAATYLALGSFVSVYNGLWLAPHRASLVPLVALLMLPFYLGFECLLRSAASARPWLPVLGRILVLAVIGVGAATELLPGFLMLAVGGFTISFALFEFVAFRAARQSPNPWMLAVYQALMSAWTQSALFPFEG